MAINISTTTVRDLRALATLAMSEEAWAAMVQEKGLVAARDEVHAAAKRRRDTVRAEAAIISRLAVRIAGSVRAVQLVRGAGFDYDRLLTLAVEAAKVDLGLTLPPETPPSITTTEEGSF
jgi:hypothetical protein